MAIDWTKPIETTDGRAARVLATNFLGGDDYPVLVAETDRSGLEIIRTFKTDGSPLPHLGRLRNKPVKREGWVNIYPGHRSAYLAYGGEIWATQEVADAMSGRLPGRIACVHIEWEE